MKPLLRDVSLPKPAHRERGFSIVSAMFLVVVLASLGAFMLTFTTAQHMSSAQDVLGVRAYSAARAGLEWGIFRARKSGACPASPPAWKLSGDLADFSVNIACVATAYEDAAGPNTVFRITATASRGTPGAADRVERSLQGWTRKN